MSGPAGTVVPALEVSGLSKSFGHANVLRDVSLTLLPGTVCGLVGANGSGKSTLIKILGGYYAASPGATIRVAGASLESHSPAGSERAGLRFVHQDLGLVAGQSTVENLGLGRGYGSRRGLPVRWREQRRLAGAALSGLGYDVDVDAPIASLTASEQTAVAVARALSGHTGAPKVLVLDEPTANLPDAEAKRLFALVERLKEEGLAVLFVSHHLPEIFELCDTVAVLRGGAIVASRQTGEFTEEGLIELMVGRSVQPHTAVETSTLAHREEVLTAAGLSGGGVQHLDLSVGAGEVVGFAGITGSGREDVAALLFGSQPRQGVVTVTGSRVRGGHPAESVAAGMGMVPAERAANATFAGHDVCENLSIARTKDFVRRGILRRGPAVTTTQWWLEELDVRPRRADAIIGQLSGGNAQKVVLARWLRLRPKLLILDEPTQGVDPGAREDIYASLAELAAAGCAVVVCSSDSTELARICTRVLVLVRGQVVTQLDAPVEADAITSACLASTMGRAA